VAELPAVAALLRPLDPLSHGDGQVSTIDVGGECQAAEPRFDKRVGAVLHVPEPGDLRHPLARQLSEELLFGDTSDLRTVEKSGDAVEAVGNDRLDVLLEERLQAQNRGVLLTGLSLDQQGA